MPLRCLVPTILYGSAAQFPRTTLGAAKIHIISKSPTVRAAASGEGVPMIDSTVGPATGPMQSRGQRGSQRDRHSWLTTEGVRFCQDGWPALWRVNLVKSPALARVEPCRSRQRTAWLASSASSIQAYPEGILTQRSRGYTDR